MQVKIPQLVTLICTLLGTLGAPALMNTQVHAHMGLYTGLVAAGMILHALLPSIFGAPSAADQQATGMSNKAGLFLLAGLGLALAYPASVRAQITPAAAHACAGPEYLRGRGIVQRERAARGGGHGSLRAQPEYRRRAAYFCVYRGGRFAQHCKALHGDNQCGGRDCAAARGGGKAAGVSADGGGNKLERIEYGLAVERRRADFDPPERAVLPDAFSAVFEVQCLGGQRLPANYRAAVCLGTVTGLRGLSSSAVSGPSRRAARAFQLSRRRA